MLSDIAAVAGWLTLGLLLLALLAVCFLNERRQRRRKKEPHAD